MAALFDRSMKMKQNNHRGSHFTYLSLGWTVFVLDSNVLGGARTECAEKVLSVFVVTWAVSILFESVATPVTTR